jgi:acetyl esterase/lipase
MIQIIKIGLVSYWPSTVRHSPPEKKHVTFVEAGVGGNCRIVKVNQGSAFHSLGPGIAAVIVISFVALGARTGRKVLRWMPQSLWTSTISDVSYGPYPENRLDVVSPRWSDSRLLPSVVVFHGGGWQRGSRSEMRDRVCRRYLSHGFLTVNVEYRHGIRLASEDAVRAVEWFSSRAVQYGADPRRIVVTGESAGAHLALLAAFQSRAAVAAVVNFYGIADLSRLSDAALLRDAIPDKDVGAVVGPLSPIAHIHPGAPPVLSLHGSADSTVLPDQSVRLTLGLRQAGGDAEVMLIDSAGHGFSPSQLESAYSEVFDFLRRRGIALT